jgi:hypothetical protein
MEKAAEEKISEITEESPKTPKADAETPAAETSQ